MGAAVDETICLGISSLYECAALGVVVVRCNQMDTKNLDPVTVSMDEVKRRFAIELVGHVRKGSSQGNGNITWKGSVAQEGKW